MAGHEATESGAEAQKERQRSELAGKLPEAEDVPPDQERGERPGTAKAVATGGGASPGAAGPPPAEGEGARG